MDRNKLAEQLQDISEITIDMVSDYQQVLCATILENSENMQEKDLQMLMMRGVRDMKQNPAQDGRKFIDTALRSFLMVMTASSLLDAMKGIELPKREKMNKAKISN